MFAAVVTVGQSPPSESSAPFVTPKLFDRIVEGERSLVAIETPRVDEVLAQFRQFALRSLGFHATAARQHATRYRLARLERKLQASDNLRLEM